MQTNSPLALSIASQHFNSRLEIVAFVFKCRQLGSEYDPLQPNKLGLPVQDKAIFSHLVSANYQTLIQRLLNLVRIDPSFVDVFSSELAPEMVSFFTSYLEKFSQQISVTADKDELLFYVETNDMFADLILTPLSQFHTEITETVIQCRKFIEAVGSDPKRLFLNANASTAFSYFIQIWVADTMGVPLKSDADILVIQENDL